MGDWTIVIEGTGCHHNGSAAEEFHDADLMTKEFIERLKGAGHQIRHASFNCGMADNSVNKDV